MFQFIVPVGKAVLIGLGAASVVGSVITLAQKRGRGRRIDLADYEFYSEEYDCLVDYDEMPREERVAVMDGILSGDLVLPK